MSSKYSLDGTEFVFFPLPFPPSSVQLLEIHSPKSAEHVDLYLVRAKACLEPLALRWPLPLESGH